MKDGPVLAGRRPTLETQPREREPRVPCAACDDLRCGCGSLLARRVPAGVELKCRRCKCTVVLPYADA